MIPLAHVVAPVAAIAVVAIGALSTSAQMGEASTGATIGMTIGFAAMIGLPTAYVAQHLAMRLLRLTGGDPREVSAGQFIGLATLAGTVAVAVVWTILAGGHFLPWMLVVGSLEGATGGVVFARLR